MLNKKIKITVFVLLLPFALSAQSNNSSKPSSVDPNREYNNIYSPRSSSSTSSKNSKSISTRKRKKMKKNSVYSYYDEKIVEYRERMKEASKKQQKAEKEMSKPQYSDPLYFGHKKPPKKRKPSKRKFCKVCGITH